CGAIQNDILHFVLESSFQSHKNHKKSPHPTSAGCINATPTQNVIDNQHNTQFILNIRCF
ncbi:hypothetical protein, partial [Paramuribaculum intestinale]|uniref:hypothetical protein n=1 Tax=Paramuribaculum intestinale TaxID=2094151 RepID=UPI0025AA0EB8